MKEHLEVPIDTSKMTDQELQFHYFKMHDADGNNKLDGLELVKSLVHWHGKTRVLDCVDTHSYIITASEEKDHGHGAGHRLQKIFKDQELADMIDPILSNDDKNKDGLIDYYEFVAAQNAAGQTSS